MYASLFHTCKHYVNSSSLYYWLKGDVVFNDSCCFLVREVSVAKLFT